MEDDVGTTIGTLLKTGDVVLVPGTAIELLLKDGGVVLEELGAEVDGEREEDTIPAAVFEGELLDEAADEANPELAGLML